MLTIGGGQVHEIGSILRKQRVLCEISTKATRAENDWALLINRLAILLVDQTCACTRCAHEQLIGTCLGDNLCLVSAFCNLLNHLDQRIGDGHAREALLSTMRSRHRMATKTCHKGEIEVELLDQPIDIRATVATE